MTGGTPQHISVGGGGGQAGLLVSYCLRQRGIDRTVFEKHTAMHVWRTQRWDSFCVVTPNWQCDLPGYPYSGPDPHGFMKKDEIPAYLDGFKARVRRPDLGRRVDGGPCGGGGYHVPIVPRMAERLPKAIRQLHPRSIAIRNPCRTALCWWSGPGSRVLRSLRTSISPAARFISRSAMRRVAPASIGGRDVVAWLADMNYYEMPVERHPLKEGVRDNANHYVTGRDGGRDIDLRRFALDGMKRYGLLRDLDGTRLSFAPGLRAALDAADRVYNGINAAIDEYAAEKKIEPPPST